MRERGEFRHRGGRVLQVRTLRFETKAKRQRENEGEENEKLRGTTYKSYASCIRTVSSRSSRTISGISVRTIHHSFQSPIRIRGKALSSSQLFLCSFLPQPSFLRQFVLPTLLLSVSSPSPDDLSFPSSLWSFFLLPVGPEP